METFLFKLILSPLLIGGVSLAGRRWGAAVSGWLIGLPLTSGPVVLFLALDQGPAFAAAAAQAIMLGIISVGLFCLTYSRLAPRWAWLPTLLAGWGVVLASTFVLDTLPSALALTIGLVFGGLGTVLVLMPRVRTAGRPGVAPRWDIPLRMIVATSFVLGLTGLATILGPRLTGLLAPFPMFASILGVFTHRLEGPLAAGYLLRGVVLGSFSFAGFFLVITLLLQPAGILPAFLAASAVALGTHGVSGWLLRHAPAAEPERGAVPGDKVHG